MFVTRRETLLLATAAAAASGFSPLMSWAEETDDLIQAFTGGEEPENGGIDFIAPEIAENGNTVPVSVSSGGAVSIMLIATANPQPNICTVNFGSKSGASDLSTRIRLAGTQEVIALAKMADGSFRKTSKEIKVTIGGCGG